MTAIIRFRDRLPSLERFQFTSHPGVHSQTGWMGHGEGRLTVTREGEIVRFHEQGEFTLTGQSRPVPMRNVYRFELFETRVSLYHERRGTEAAVWLFDLIPGDGDTLVSEAVHQCADDTYRGAITLVDGGLDFVWRIKGPRKDERLDYRYR